MFRWFHHTSNTGELIKRTGCVGGLSDYLSGLDGEYISIETLNAYKMFRSWGPKKPRSNANPNKDNRPSLGRRARTVLPAGAK